MDLHTCAAQASAYPTQPNCAKERHSASTSRGNCRPPRTRTLSQIASSQACSATYQIIYNVSSSSDPPPLLSIAKQKHECQGYCAPFLSPVLKHSWISVTASEPKYRLSIISKEPDTRSKHPSQDSRLPSQDQHIDISQVVRKARSSADASRVSSFPRHWAVCLADSKGKGQVGRAMAPEQLQVTHQETLPDTRFAPLSRGR
jgi:hypothetical protein